MEYKKAITFSFDDGVIYDKKLIRLLDKYNLKGTFNINSGNANKDYCWKHSTGLEVRRILLSDIKSVYEGHEVASHGYMHGGLLKMSDFEVYDEINKDIELLENTVSYKVKGFAYPCGNYDERSIKVLKDLGIKYARTINSNYVTEKQTVMYEYLPTCHLPCDIFFNDASLIEKITDEFLNSTYDKPSIFYIWGHSYECEAWGTWGIFEEFLKKISFKKDILYGTNSEVFEYFNMI